MGVQNIFIDHVKGNYSGVYVSMQVAVKTESLWEQIMINARVNCIYCVNNALCFIKAWAFGLVVDSFI